MLHRISLRRFGAIALSAVIAVISTLSTAIPAKAAAPPIKVDARSAILIDFTTGQVLHEQDADLPIPPASLTKLMTLHLAYKKIADGTMKREDKVTVRPEAWSANCKDCSLMFLEPGQNVTVGEIMKGIAIPSGNDASVAMAQHIAGTVEAFVAMMNKEAQDLGFKTMKFADPAGLSPQNMVTAREFARFCQLYITQHPEALQELHSVREFSYPQPQNLPPDKKNEKPILQYNRNTLLGEVEGVDGLKTGFIDEAGYNIALTAKRGDMRLIAVVLGVPGRSTAEGSARRAKAGTDLLEWGFKNFATVKPTLPAVKPVRVWKGAANEVALEPERPVLLTVARGLETKVTGTVQQESSIMAPVKKGDKLGEMVFTAENQEVARVKLVAAADVKQGGFFKRMWDSLRLWISGLFTKKK